MNEIKKFTLIKQGAEARIYTGTYLGRPAVIKERFIKKYRHSNLDNSLTKERMKAETRAIVRCKAAGVLTPTIYLVDFNRRRIYMEYYNDAITAKDFIISLEKESDERKLADLAENIGNVIGRMHLNGIIHGDLTTSNILLVKDKDSVDFTKYTLAMIDFGLAHTDSNALDKGVDLYVLERALLSTHSCSDKLLPIIFKSYRNINKNGSKDVFVKYEDIKARGRKRTMVG